MIELDFIRNIEKMKIEEIEWIVKTESAMFFLSNSIRPGPRIEFAQYNSNNFGNLNFQKSYFRIFKVHFSIFKTPGVIILKGIGSIFMQKGYALSLIIYGRIVKYQPPKNTMRYFLVFSPH